ncbi:hypothetical protein H0H93_006237 [Arthromyces matolae]|nr:hypothetical protein H0H93_006237 [Arthromyces matolae]
MVSPSNKFKATTTIFDESAETIIVEGDLTLHMRYSFVKPQPAKVLIKFKLDNHSGTHRICSQEYYYHPDQFANMIFPPIAPLVTLGLSVSAYVSAFSAKFAQVFGIWRVSDTGKTRANGGHKAGSKGLGVGDSQSSDDSRSGLKPVNGKQRRRNGGSGHHNPQPE